MAAVTTRAQEKRERQAIKPLIVAKSHIHDISAHELKEAQQNYLTLENLWESARAETPQQTRGKTMYRYKVQKGVLYHVYNSSHSGEVK